MDAFTPWHQREGFEDVVPVPQDDGPNPMVPIAYPKEYSSAMDTFRYFVSTGEKSQRVLDVTQALVKMNTAHYTVWTYRGQTLLATGASIESELDMMDHHVKAHLKSYQVWQHRRNMVLALPAAIGHRRELPFCTRTLAIDSKNYHTWVYRHWVLSHFFGPDSACVIAQADERDDALRMEKDVKFKDSVWQGELDYAESLLNEDLRNNSAWNHRWFVVYGSDHSNRASHKNAESLQERELEYCKDKISIAPNNPSAWNYLRGVLRHSKTALIALNAFVEPLTRLESPSCRYALEWQADSLAESKDQAQVKQAAEVYAALAEQHDPIRRSYWNHLSRKALSSVAVS
ncbi:uncharacterized protein L969DRAFT_86625 [Mixia osmundae IAM 14324]|uniref:Protein farnesyltransferase/geranylgeranyltransferase type-1 subunit alpha n=1 Tax=Mixia osmundae (strain CBS 9802 / IAM 14324 / JCM 22182 / KY 12970) TaxID=764103 RepID=G7E9S2_MIXOS|nr:uncharacterized protein L969DRAFT_86625 [Mixia osmundae IAM 14324]KEI40023.1 hypothetical protein L969DRAFT_86625 [Mixia osmundae IAM 14324]GAA99391.1 hypothetical protein E5Q_06088 [Mixia osmundae IAM 14324]